MVAEKALQSSYLWEFIVVIQHYALPDSTNSVQAIDMNINIHVYGTGLTRISW